MRKKYLLIGVIILVALCCLVVAYLKNNTTSEEDIQSLENTRLQYFTVQNDTTRFELVNRLVHDALKYKSDRYAATGYFFLMQYYQAKVFAGDESYRDSIYFYYNIANEYYEKSGYEMGLVNSRFSRVHTLLMEGSGYVALGEAMKSYERFEDSKDEGVLFYINWTMFMCYLLSIESVEDGYENTFLYLNKSIYHLGRWKETDEVNRVRILQYYITAFTIYSELNLYLKRYDLALHYCNLYKLFVDIEIANSKQENYYNKFKVDCFYTRILSEMGHVNEARPFFERIEQKYKNPDFKMHSIGLIGYYEACIAYYREFDYDKTIKYVPLLKDMLNNYAIYEDLLLFYKSASDIYFKNKDYLSVIDIKNEIIHYTDSINKVSALRQVDYLKRTSQMELNAEKDKEKIRQLTYVRGIALSLGIICILLVTSIYLKMKSDKISREKNERILRQYRDMDKYINEINNLTNQLKNTENDSNTKELTLFEKIEKHLHTTQAYSNPTITRETLALELGTNRQYLTQAIHDEKGQSFMEYINDLRLEYARSLLFNQPELTVDRVYAMSGFSTKSTFYRLFKQKYGLTPTEVRDLSTAEI